MNSRGKSKIYDDQNYQNNNERKMLSVNKKKMNWCGS